MLNTTKLLVTFFLTLTVINYAGDVKGKITAKGVKNAEYTVVYIDKIEGKTFAPPEEPAQINQLDMTFAPHVLPILVGTTVEFLNSDAVLHNVFSPDGCADKFNLGTWPQGQKKTFTFEKPCVAVLLCNVHPEMEGYIIAVETPYFAVADKKGNYEIKDVPPGKYTLKVWHEKLKTEPVEIVVAEKGDVEQNFTIKK